MLQIAVYYTNGMYVAAKPLTACYERAVAPEHDVYLHAGLRGGIKFLYNVRLGYMVYLHLYPCLAARACILYLLVDKTYYPCLHRVWRHHKFSEPELRERTVDKVEHLLNLSHDTLARRHHQIVGVHLGVTFMEVARTDTGNAAFGRLYIEQLRVNLKSLHAIYHVYAFFLHALAPAYVALLVETGKKLNHGRNLLAVACGAYQRLNHL